MSRAEPRSFPVSNSLETQDLLDKAYALVTKKLRFLDSLIKPSSEELTKLRKFGDRLQDHLPTEQPDSTARRDGREEIVSELTWTPIAQRCVIRLLKSILQKSDHGLTEFSADELRTLAEEISRLPDFNKSLGLDQEYARLALAKTMDTFLENDLFKHPTWLRVDDESYFVCREKDYLIVKRAA